MTVGNKTTVTNSMNYYVQESPSVKRRCYAFVKRAFDIVASAAALIILSPIMLIAAILVYVDDPGKVFYGHVRIGKNGKPFKMWKFRSMYMNADKMINLLTPEQSSRIRYRAEHTDIGLILQQGTLLVDTAALTDACAQYLAELPERAKREADWLRQHDVAAALCDMPLWSISACEQAGVPLLYVGNFTWTELYREFLPEHIWKAYAAEYRKIQHGMLYALHNPEMLEFLPRAELSETSLVARPFHPDEIRAIRTRHTCPIVFVALGMSAQFTQPVSVEGVEAHFYVTEGVPLTGSNVTVIPYSTLHTQDYVAAADYVITKAGWGTVAECLLAQKPMALFARDSVLEDRTTIRLLEQKKLGIKVTYEQLTEMSDLLEQMKQITYPAVPEYHNAAAEIVSKLLTLTE